MFHPIFSALVSRPELVLNHVAGYAALAREEAVSVGGEVVKRAIAWGVAVFCLLFFLLFAGIAIMLGAMNDEFHWMLVLVPGVPLAIGIAAVLRARQHLPHKPFMELRSQLNADAQVLRSMGAGS